MYLLGSTEVQHLNCILFLFVSMDQERELTVLAGSCFEQMQCETNMKEYNNKTMCVSDSATFYIIQSCTSELKGIFY